MMVFTGNQIYSVHRQVSDLLRHDYFDVRLEIVDHLLAHMEESMTHQSDLEFYAALNDAIDSMEGRKGMRKIERFRIKQVRRTFIVNHLKALISAFKPPQVFLSILVLVIIYQLILITDTNVLGFYLLGCCLTGAVEYIEAYKMRKRYDLFSISSLPIYTKSSWLTNTPLLLLIFAFHSWFDLGWMSEVVVSISLFGYMLFFIFKFKFLRRGLYNDMQRYQALHHDLINMPI